MKKIKKFLPILLVLALLLTACGGGGEDATTDEGEEVSEKNVLIMATHATFPPYEFHDGGEIVGIDVEIAEKIAEELGMTLEIDDMDFGAIINAVTSGKADMGMAGMSVTEDRLESVDFSEPYAQGIQSIIVKEGSDIKSIDDLDGKIIGVQIATTGDIYVSEDYGEDAIERFNAPTDAVTSLIQGKIDAVIIDNSPAETFVADNEGLIILDTSYAEEEYAICFAKDNEELKDAVNEALKSLTEDGTIQGIIDKYIK